MKRIALACAALLFAASGCASTPTTTLESSWRAPDAGPLRFEKILVLAVIHEESVRRAVEDEIVRRVPGSIAGHTVVPDSELDDPERVKARALATGADGGILLRLVGMRQEADWIPGSFPASHSSPWGFYGESRHAVQDPGYVQVDDYLRFQTNIYDLREVKLVWSGLTETFEPDSVADLVDEIAAVVAEELRKEKLVTGERAAPAY